MKKLLLIILGVTLALCGLGFGLLRWASTSLFGEPLWSETSIPKANVPGVFGVTVPPTATHLLTRQSGFQDPYFEGLFEVPEAEVDSFLAANHLTRSTLAMVQVPTDAATVVGLQGAPVAEGLEGLVDKTGGDGGFVELYRSATLLKWPGHTFVYLVAFGT